MAFILFALISILAILSIRLNALISALIIAHPKRLKEDLKTFA